MNDSSSRRFTTLELLCVFFWFLLDGFWLLESHAITYAFSICSLIAAALMFVYIKRELIVVLIACADTSWLLCNVTWAVGDLSHLPRWLLAAKLFFFIGLALVLCAFCASDLRNKLSVLILSRLRIMKYLGKLRT